MDIYKGPVAMWWFNVLLSWSNSVANLTTIELFFSLLLSSQWARNTRPQRFAQNLIQMGQVSRALENQFLDIHIDSISFRYSALNW
jgi:hypothetical protein